MSTRPATDSARPPHVAVLIVSYNARDLLTDCLRSLLSSLAPVTACTWSITVVDNASASFDATLLRDEFPEIELVALSENRGFAGGNNAGWAAIDRRRPDTDYLVLLNQDTLLATSWLEPLLARLEADSTVAAVQPLIVLDSQPPRINTAGNDCHFLGFGLMRDYGAPVDAAGTLPREIASASGAAVVLRAAAIREVGLFDDRYFLYLEDVELAWKLRLAGYRLELAPVSSAVHRYTFQAPYRHYRLLERNRYWLLLTFYRWRTLFLLAPAIALMEAGQWVFALRHGLCSQRCTALAEILHPRALRQQLAIRRARQSARRITDRELTAPFVAKFDAALLPGFLVQRISNPLLAAYWWVARRLIVW